MDDAQRGETGIVQYNALKVLIIASQSQTLIQNDYSFESFLTFCCCNCLESIVGVDDRSSRDLHWQKQLRLHKLDVEQRLGLLLNLLNIEINNKNKHFDLLGLNIPLVEAFKPPVLLTLDLPDCCAKPNVWEKPLNTKMKTKLLYKKLKVYSQDIINW